MTKTASQKARAAKAKQNQSKVNSNNQNLPKQKGKVTTTAPKVVARGSSILTQVPSRRLKTTSTYFKALGQVNYKGKIAEKVIAKDFIQTIQFQTSNTVGATLMNMMVCPTLGQFVGTRLQRYASMFEKYLFTNLRVCVDSGAGSSVNGEYLIAYDKDPADPTPPTGDAGLREFFGMEGTQPFQAGVSGEVSFPLSDPQDFYYTDPGYYGISDERLYTQGQIYIAVGSQAWSSTVNVTLYLEYEILFFDPQLGALTNEAKFASNSYSPSNTPGQAWPVVSIPDAARATVGEGVQHILDSTSTYRGFRLDPGTYFVEQLIKNVANAQTINSPFLTALDPSRQGTLIDSVIDNIPATVAGSHVIRTSKLTVPIGGATLFGSVLNNTLAIDNFVVRIMNLGQSLIF